MLRVRWGEVVANRCSGHAAFLDPDVNKALKKVLQEWGNYLSVSRILQTKSFTR